MYFVAHLIKPKIKVVIPDGWVYEVKKHLVKFVNRSLNHNQTFLVFFSDKPNALNDHGQPNNEFPANFDLGIDVTFPNEGCYLANLLRCEGNS